MILTVISPTLGRLCCFMTLNSSLHFCPFVSFSLLGPLVAGPQILEERTSELSKRQRHLSTGETRQFDHRPAGERNPLFDRLDEKERR